MTKKIGSILLIFTFIISLVGCEKKIETGSISGFDENEEYISMWIHTIENTPEGEAYKKSVDLFNKKYNGKYFLDIEFIPRNENGGGYSDKINAGVMSGDLPDIITVDGPNVSAYVANNIIQPLEGVSEKDKSVYLDSIIEQGTVNNKLYTLGAMESSVGLYYNKDIIEKAGVEIPSMNNPWTWDEFYEVCEKIKNVIPENDYPIDMTFPSGESTIYYYAPFIWSNGGDFVSKDGLTVDGYFNSEKTYETVEYFKKLLDNKMFSKTKIENLFELERAAFKFDGAWLVNNMKTSYPDFNLGIAPYPVGNDWNQEKYTPTGSWTYAVSTNCTNVSAATEAVKWLSGVESGVILSELTGNMPSTYEAYDRLPQFKDGLYEFLKEQLITYGHPRPKTPVYPQVSEQYQRSLEDIVLNNKDKKDTIEYSVERIDAKLKRYR